MKPVLVTGAAGFVGRAVVANLVDLVPVVAVTRATVGDINKQTQWDRHLEGAGAVIHLAARVHAVGEPADDPQGLHMKVNFEGTVALAEAARKAGVSRFIFVSTVKVMGESSPKRPFTEADPPHPVSEYAKSKWAAEQALAEIAGSAGATGSAPMELTVFRPPLIYGPGAKANFRTLMRLCASPLPLPFAAYDGNRLSVLYVKNFVDALIKALTHPGAPGRTFLIRDGEDVSTAGLIRRLRAALGRPPRLFPLPPSLLTAAAALLGKAEPARRLLDSLAVDDRQLREAMDWTPPYTLDEGLAATAAGRR